MPRWDAWLEGLAGVLGPLLLTVPPKLGSRRPGDLAETLRLAWRQRGLSVRTVADWPSDTVIRAYRLCATRAFRRSGSWACWPGRAVYWNGPKTFLREIY